MVKHNFPFLKCGLHSKFLSKSTVWKGEKESFTAEKPENYLSQVTKVNSDKLC